MASAHSRLRICRRLFRQPLSCVLIRDQDVDPAATDRGADGGVLGGTSGHPYPARNPTHRIHANADDPVIEGGDVPTGRIEEPQAEVATALPLWRSTLAEQEGRLEASYSDQQQAQLLPGILDRGEGRSDTSAWRVAGELTKPGADTYTALAPVSCARRPVSRVAVA
jgi:hypothetical protein